MRRITLSVPEELADDLARLSYSLGVTKSAFLSVYLQKRLKRLADIAGEYEHLRGDGSVGARMRNRGQSAEEVLDLAERIIDHFEREEAERGE